MCRGSRTRNPPHSKLYKLARKREREVLRRGQRGGIVYADAEEDLEDVVLWACGLHLPHAYVLSGSHCLTGWNPGEILMFSLSAKWQCSFPIL